MYDEIFAKYYDLLTFNIDYKKRAEYFDKIIKKYIQTDNNILCDLGCGTGSLTVEFPKLGYDVIGIDFSEAMLDSALKKSESKNIQYLCQDISELDLFGSAGIFISALDTLNHLESADEIFKVFKRVSLFCEKGGLFIFDMNTPYKHKKILGDESFIYDMDDIFLAWQNEFEGGEENRVNIYLDFFEKIENHSYMRNSESFSEIAFDINFIKNLIEKSGMKLYNIYDEDSFNAPKEDSERIIFVSGKDV